MATGTNTLHKHISAAESKGRHCRRCACDSGRGGRICCIPIQLCHRAQGRKPKMRNTRQDCRSRATAPCLSAEGPQSAGPACRTQLGWLASDRRTHTHMQASVTASHSQAPVHCRPLTKYSIVVSRMKLGVKKQTVSPMQPANYIGSEGRRSGENRRERESCVLNITSQSEQMST